MSEEQQYIALTPIIRNPVIKAGTLVPVGEGEDAIHPDDVDMYLAAGIIRKREVKEPAEPARKTVKRGKNDGDTDSNLN